jgi:hypothetical protein
MHNRSLFEYLSEVDLMAIYGTETTEQYISLALEIERSGYPVTQAATTCLEGIQHSLRQVANSVGERSDYIRLLRIIPQAIFDSYKFVPMSEQEMIYLIEIKNGYSVKADWLDYLVTRNKPASFKLLLSHYQAVKPLARYSKAIMNLAIAVYERSPGFQQDFTSPLDLWFQIECCDFRALLLTNGLLTNKPINVGSKQHILESAQAFVSGAEAGDFTDYCKHFLKQNPKTKPELELDQELMLGVYLKESAITLARFDPVFRQSSEYKEYLAATKALATNGRKNITPIYFQKGVTVERGRETSKKRPKGFV